MNVCLVTITIVIFLRNERYVIRIHKDARKDYHKLITICFIKINNEVIIFCDVNRQC